MITTIAFGQQSETVYLNGATVGQISGKNEIWFAQPLCRAGTYRFASHADAVSACVSHATVGYWTNEV